VRETLHKVEHLPAIFIQPVSIAYVGVNSRLVAWAREDEIEFLPHLLQVAALRRVDVALTWGEPIQADVNSDRKVLAKHLEETVRRMAAEAHRSDAHRADRPSLEAGKPVTPADGGRPLPASGER